MTKALADLKYTECAPIISVETMRFLDRDTKTNNAVNGYFANESDPLNVAGYALMKEAGRALFKIVTKELENSTQKNVAIFIGGGGNGGDGLVLAKLLKEANIQSTVFSLAQSFKNESAIAYKDFKETCSEIKFISDSFENKNFTLIVDCMLGSGAKGNLRTNFANVVTEINKSNIKVIAADSPTGFDTLNKQPCKPCIKATKTILFGLPRLEAYIAQNAPFFGQAIVAQLHYPDFLIDKVNDNVYLATENIIKKLLPTRNEFVSKREHGLAMIVAGNKNMSGAPVLCAKAALKSGLGLLTLAVPGALQPILQASLYEPIFCGLGDNDNDKISVLHLQKLQECAKYQNAIAIGPGLGTDLETQNAIRMFLTELATPVVIDADAINACGSAFFCKSSTPTNAIITPHKREWERNFGKLPASEFLYPEYLRKFAKQFNVTILLKGCPTYIALTDGRVYVILAHNSGLSKGGNGDVLTGIIVSLLSQGLPTPEAAVLGALIHQKAGELARKELSAFSMQPSDVIQKLSQVFIAASKDK